MFAAFFRFLFALFLFRIAWGVGRWLFGIDSSRRGRRPRAPGEAGKGDDAPFGGAPVEDAEWEEVDRGKGKSS